MACVAFLDGGDGVRCAGGHDMPPPLSVRFPHAASGNRARPALISRQVTQASMETAVMSKGQRATKEKRKPKKEKPKAAPGGK